MGNIRDVSGPSQTRRDRPPRTIAGPWRHGPIRFLATMAALRDRLAGTPPVRMGPDGECFAPRTDEAMCNLCRQEMPCFVQGVPPLYGLVSSRFSEPWPARSVTFHFGLSCSPRALRKAPTQAGEAQAGVRLFIAQDKRHSGACRKVFSCKGSRRTHCQKQAIRSPHNGATPISASSAGPVLKPLTENSLSSRPSSPNQHKGKCGF